MKKNPYEKWVRKIFVLIANFLFNHTFFYKFLGLINKKFNFLNSVFVDYPASDYYTGYYFFYYFWEKIKWNPWISGIMFFKGKIILKFSITNKQDDFINPDNKKKLKSLYCTTLSLKNNLNAKYSTFAGILPGVFLKNKITRETSSAVITAKLIFSSIKDLIDKKIISEGVQIISIGGLGFVGRKLNDIFEKEKIKYSVVDTKREETKEWPKNLEIGNVLILNLLSTSKVLENYLPFFPENIVFLNEAYPPPDGSLLKNIKKKNIKVFHVCGNRASVFPEFPGKYSGNKKESSIPCCAIPSFLGEAPNPVLLEL